MSVLRRFGSSTRLNNLATLDTSHVSKASSEHSSKRSEASQQTSRSAPGERSKYQLWPALEQRTQKPLPGCPDPAVVPCLDRKRSVRVHQSVEQMCRVYEGASDLRPQQSMHSSKRTQASPKDPQQPMLGVAKITSATRTNRRSSSAPGRTHQSETLRPHKDASMEYRETTSPPQHDLSEEALTTGEGRASMKRASSVLLPAELNDLIFPKLQRREFDADGRKIEALNGKSHPTVPREDCEKETPPAVPPKTPPKYPNPTLYVSPLKLRTTRAPACDKALPQIETVGSPTDESAKFQGESKHVRDGSGDSVMDRGRPPTRSRSQTRRGIMGSREGSSVDLTGDTLPRGWPAAIVGSSLMRDEIRKLEHQSRIQAGRFEVLQLKDVKALSQQVRLLDEQCEYLRGFAKSLRRNRKTLHAQTIAYLKSPALSGIPLQSMLQKVETLADLDDTIDEWAKKLERAEDQRLRTRQRLLEHIAAVLSIPSVKNTKEEASGGLGTGREQTPPQSPERLNSPPMIAGYDVESIRIYAGSEMHALLGVLDKETMGLTGTENFI